MTGWEVRTGVMDVVGPGVFCFKFCGSSFDLKTAFASFRNYEFAV